MDESLNDYLNRPGDAPGARRVRRLLLPHPQFALETWTGDEWDACGIAINAQGVAQWLGHPGATVTPWTPGRGRHRA
ncbi:hypothetical protein [Embleya sp. NBC_00896]|uniref:hypothetical protein n=1 Tax=Embleya sp. NBC_00896 TaxID=2975961 RepID=UPI002F918C49|nr:hypothetical protein OG928_47775 [Embleya sp. NBC_00896]